MEKLAVLSTSPLFDMLSNQELEYVADLSRPRLQTGIRQHLIRAHGIGRSWRKGRGEGQG